MARRLTLLLVMVLLAACGGPEEPTPDATQTRAAVAQAVAATLTAGVPTAAPTPTTSATPRPPTPTLTQAPTATPALSLTPSVTPTPTLRPSDRALLDYLTLFAPVANVIWASVADPSDAVTPADYADRVGALCEDLEAMTVPAGAEEMHNAFEMVSNRVHVWHLNRALALMNPDSFEEYMAAADLAAKQMLEWHPQYLSARDLLLARLGVTAESVGFQDVAYTATPRPTSTPSPTKPPPTPVPTKAPTPTPVLQLLADSLTDFSGGQGQNSWEWLFAARDSFDWRQMSYDGWCYLSSEAVARICADQGAPGRTNDVAWLYKAEVDGRLLFRVTAHKLEAVGDDIDISVYRHTNRLYTWSLKQGDTKGFTSQFELNVNGGEMIFFTMHISTSWREFKYDPNAFRVQVYLRE